VRDRDHRQEPSRVQGPGERALVALEGGAGLRLASSVIQYAISSYTLPSRRDSNLLSAAGRSPPRLQSY